MRTRIREYEVVQGNGNFVLRVRGILGTRGYVAASNGTSKASRDALVALAAQANLARGDAPDHSPDARRRPIDEIDSALDEFADKMNDFVRALRRR